MVAFGQPLPSDIGPRATLIVFEIRLPMRASFLTAIESMQDLDNPAASCLHAFEMPLEVRVGRLISLVNLVRRDEPLPQIEGLRDANALRQTELFERVAPRLPSDGEFLSGRLETSSPRSSLGMIACQFALQLDVSFHLLNGHFVITVIRDRKQPAGIRLSGPLA